MIVVTTNGINYDCKFIDFQENQILKLRLSSNFENDETKDIILEFNEIQYNKIKFLLSVNKSE